MPVKDGRWISPAEWQAEQKAAKAAAAPKEDAKDESGDESTAKAPRARRAGAAAAIKDATGVDVSTVQPQTVDENNPNAGQDEDPFPDAGPEDGPREADPILDDGGKFLTPEKVAEAEEDPRAHSGDTVYRDAADQIAGREDPIGTPAGAPIGAIPGGADNDAEQIEADKRFAEGKPTPGVQHAPEGTTTSKSLKGLGPQVVTPGKAKQGAKASAEEGK